MKTVYDANTALDAHMIKGLLEQSRIHAFVDGEYLQGGVGDLQTFGLVKVRVHDEDYDAARAIVEAWEQADADASDSCSIATTPASSSSAPNQALFGLIMAFGIGVGVGYLLGSQ